MAEPRPTFICLDPRKDKRAAIEAILGDLGPIAFQPTVPMRWQDYPETRAVAEAAHAAAIRKPKGRLKAWLKRRLFEIQYNGARHFFERHPGVAVCWNGLNGSRYVFMQAAKDAGCQTLYFELAPLPARITADPKGINFRSSLPREIAFYRTWIQQADVDPEAWRAVRGQIRQRPPARQMADSTTGLPPLTDPFLFVALQVPGDSQLRLFGGEFRTVPDFVDAICEAAERLPQGWHIRIKEHPSSKTSVAARIAERGGTQVYLDNTTDTFGLVAASQGVVTVNSSVGLEAMFYDKPVVAAGQCFWALDGLAYRAPDAETLALLFADPESLNFSQADRDAFMSYLVAEYYLRLDRTSDGTPVPMPAEGRRLLARLKAASADSPALPPDPAGTPSPPDPL